MATISTKLVSTIIVGADMKGRVGETENNPLPEELPATTPDGQPNPATGADPNDAANPTPEENEEEFESCREKYGLSELEALAQINEGAAHPFGTSPEGLAKEKAWREGLNGAFDGTVLVIGDSIAVGIVDFANNTLKGTVTKKAAVGASSAVIAANASWDSPSESGPPVDFTVTGTFSAIVISAGSNDPTSPSLVENLKKIRAKQPNALAVWIAPYDATAKAAVKKVAGSEAVVDLSSFARSSSSNPHPTSYEPVAQAVQKILDASVANKGSKPVQKVNCSDIPADAAGSFKLSKHYDLATLTNHTILGGYALKDNAGLTKAQIACNLRHLAVNCLDPIKEHFAKFGWEVKVSSGFRTGSGASNHDVGSAADLQFYHSELGGMATGKNLARVVKAINEVIQVPYTQMIFEADRIVHIACKKDGVNSNPRLFWSKDHGSHNGGENYRYQVALEGKPKVADAAQVASGISAGDPPWLVEARKYLGLKEDSRKGFSNSNVAIFHKSIGSQYTSDDTPWCGSFVGHCMKAVGQPHLGAQSVTAKEWNNWGKSCTAQVGAIAVFTRKGGGHVTFVIGEDDDIYYCLGGNQEDSVQILGYRKSNLLGFRWASNVPLSNKKLPRMTGKISKSSQ